MDQDVLSDLLHELCGMKDVQNRPDCDIKYGQDASIPIPRPPHGRVVNPVVMDHLSIQRILADLCSLL